MRIVYCAAGGAVGWAAGTMGHLWVSAGSSLGWIDWVVLLSQLGCRRHVRCRRIDCLLHLDAEDVAWPKHVAGEDHPFVVRREAHVGLFVVVVVRHVDQMFGVEYAGLPEVRRVHSVGIAADHLRTEELYPCAIAGGWSLAGEGAVAGEEREVLGDVDVDGAIVAPRVIGEALAGLHVVEIRRRTCM